MKFGANNHVPLWMNFNNFVDPKTFSISDVHQGNILISELL